MHTINIKGHKIAFVNCAEAKSEFRVLMEQCTPVALGCWKLIKINVIRPLLSIVEWPERLLRPLLLARSTSRWFCTSFTKQNWGNLVAKSGRKSEGRRGAHCCRNNYFVMQIVNCYMCVCTGNAITSVRGNCLQLHYEKHTFRQHTAQCTAVFVMDGGGIQLLLFAFCVGKTQIRMQFA